MAEENQEEIGANEAANAASAEVKPAAAANGNQADSAAKKRPHRSQKVGVITSDKMLKTVVVRVDRLVRHTKYRRYVRRTSKFMAHDEMGATVGDKVRIVETRPMSARKRWRVIEIVQKAAK
jgi:small subunit ribosomal protein S17